MHPVRLWYVAKSLTSIYIQISFYITCIAKCIKLVFLIIAYVWYTVIIEEKPWFGLPKTNQRSTNLLIIFYYQEDERYIFAVGWKNIGSYWQYIIVYFCLHYASFKHNRPTDAYTEIPNGMWIFNLILKSLQYILYASYKLLISIDEDEVVSNV